MQKLFSKFKCKLLFKRYARLVMSLTLKLKYLLKLAILAILVTVLNHLGYNTSPSVLITCLLIVLDQAYAIIESLLKNDHDNNTAA